jgi:anti-sigma B factor antagonist
VSEPLNFGSDWTIGQAAELHTQLMGALQSGEPVTLDLSGVEAIDSAGVQLLLSWRATLSERGMPVGLMGVSATVRSALTVYGLGAELLGE